MPVRDPHQEYRRYIEKWTRCRHVADGQDAVHDAGDKYLPMLKDQTPEDYEAYKKRALFFNATWRTIAGMCGMMFRKAPTVTVPESISPLLEDVTLNEEPLPLFALTCAIDILITGRVGIFVDYPVTPPEATRADAARLNLRPTMKMYCTESITNWQLTSVNNRVVVSQVRLMEEHTVKVNEFTEKTETRYRVLDLDSAGNYRMRIFISTEAGGDQQVGDDIYPLMGSSKMQFIPFYPVSVDGITWHIDEPPQIDLVNVNLSHYRVTADYEHGCHFTGLPTPYVAGHSWPTKPNGTVSNERLYVGQSHAWVFPKAETKVGYLEFSGAGLTELRENLREKKAMMAVLGARMLEDQKKDAETVEVASLHRSGEESILSTIASSLSMGIKAALKVFTLWAGAASAEDVEFAINKQFFPIPMAPGEITALVDAWMRRAISKEVMFANLKKGQIVPDEAVFEEEETKIENDQSLIPLVPDLEVDAGKGTSGDVNGGA